MTYSVEDLALLASLQALDELADLGFDEVHVPRTLHDALTGRGWVSERGRLTRVGARELAAFEDQRDRERA